MSVRLDYGKVDAEAIKGIIEIEKYMFSAGFDKNLYHLVKLRASQINACAYCVDMHTKDARKAGESAQRVLCLSAWRETDFYSDRERAALAWTEALTEISQNEVSDELYQEVRNEFSEEELVTLSMGIISINAWNRLAIPFGADVGSHKA